MGKTINGRYNNHIGVLKKLKGEREWLISVKKLLEEEQRGKLKGKMSGYIIGTIIEEQIDKALERLSDNETETAGE